MELQIKAYKSQPIEWNYEELKTQLLAKLQDYKTLQYTPEQIQAAKTDRANLNSLKKALSDERIRRKKEFLEPFDTFEAQIKELCNLIEEPVQLIDAQIKECEEKERQEKRDKCVELFGNTEHPEWLTFEQIENPKWGNKTVTLKAVEEEIKERIAKINADLTLISALPDYSFEATEWYKRTLDATASLAEGRRLFDIQKRKKQAEEIPFMAEPEDMIEIKADKEDAEPVRRWVKFEAYMSAQEAAELREFLKYNHIAYEAIKEGE